MVGLLNQLGLIKDVYYRLLKLVVFYNKKVCVNILKIWYFK